MVTQKTNLKPRTMSSDTVDPVPVSLSETPSFARSVYRRFVALWSLDFRALAACRIAIAAIVIADVLDRLQEIEAHYCNSGVLPLDVLSSMGDNFNAHRIMPLFLLSGQPAIRDFFAKVGISEVAVQGTLMSLLLAFAIALLLGWRTRIMTLLTWYFLISLQARNPLILNGSDVLLRMILLWSLFLPVGARYSLDSRRRTETPVQERAFSVASVAIILQVCVVYWFTAYMKNAPEWNREFTAVYYALHIEQYSTPLGLWASRLPMPILQGMTIFTILLEWCGPVLAFVPSRWNCVRTTVALTFIGFHGIALNLLFDLGGFSIIASAAWILFLPAEFWNSGERLFKRLPRTDSSTSRVFGLPVWLNYVAGFLLAYVVLWNFRSVSYNTFSPILPKESDIVAQITRTDQYWAMFSPKPTTDDGWYVFPGRLKNGVMIDLFRNNATPVNWEKPEMLSRTYKSERWRKYFMNLWLQVHNDKRMYYGRWVCRSYNRNKVENAMLDTFEMYFMLRRPNLDYTTQPVKKTLIWTHYCFGNMPTKPIPAVEPKKVFLDVKVRELPIKPNAPSRP